MKTTSSLPLRLCWLVFLVIVLVFGSALAQTPNSPEIVSPLQDASRVTLKGNVHPLAQARYDLGAVSDSFPTQRMLLLLQRSAQQETALRQFLHDAHRPGNPRYHKWLTPEQFGTTYGPSDEDIATVTSWLQSQGFSVTRLTKGKTAIEFSGTASQVRNAFHTDIHAYSVDGVQHYANNADPQIPAALAPVIAGITPMNNFAPRPYIKNASEAVYDARAHKFVPQWTFPPTGYYFLDLAPGDFAIQYDLNPLYTSGVTGTGVTIGIIGASNVDPSVVATYRSFFGLPPNPLNVVIDGADPGENGAVVESYLDVEQSGAVAPGATINLYTAADTDVQYGLNLAALRAVEDDVATVLSTSYGNCEQNFGAAGNQFWAAVWEQAAAQGQTSFVSSGDGGPAGCDNFNSARPAQYGIAVNAIASTPWDVAVGGTDFYYSSYNGTASAQQTELQNYWNTVATIYPTTSLLQPVPEQPWNDPFGLDLYDGGVYDANAPNIVSGSGGPSSCSTGVEAANGTYSSCTAGYAKPSWQTGTGVPADGVRDLPDVSLFAAGGENGTVYPICVWPGECVVDNGDLTIGIVGGTSASSPAMAGIMALINQKYGRQGQANFILYPLAAQHPAVFHDITTGSNMVPCLANTPNCALSNASDNTKGYYVLGFNAAPGYDMATGLGSVDANLLVQNWNSLTFKSTSTTLSLDKTSFTHGSPVKVSVGVSGSGGTPTGDVALVTTAAAQSNTGVGDLNLQAGAASTSFSNLPGGQYTISARYAGDNLFASSSSTPVSVNVAPEASNLSLSGNYFLYTNYTSGVLTNGGSYPYGSGIALVAQAVGVNAPPGSTDGMATGTVTFTDAASTGSQNSGPVNVGSASLATWEPTGFSVGTHSVSASYSGDASFNASSSATPLNFTITKAIPGTQLWAPSYPIARGQSVTLALYLAIYSVVPPPTGTVTFYSGNTVLGTATVATSTIYWPYPASTATLNVTTLPVGIDSITAKYSGDASYEAATSDPVLVTVTQQPVATLTATANASSMLPTQDLIVSVNLAGVNGQPVPTGYISFYASGPGGSSSSSCTLVNGSCNYDFSGGYWSPGTVTVNVGYSGDATYAADGTDVQVTMLNMFTMTAAPSVSFAAGATKGNSAALTVTPSNGFTGPVYFACTIAYYPPGAQHLPTCSVPVSVNVTGTAAVTAAMSITSTPPTTVARADEINTLRRLATQSLAFVAGIFVIGLPLRRRIRPYVTAFCVLVVLVGCMASVSCGGGNGPGGGGHMIPGTTPGTYKFMVDGAYTPNASSTSEPLFYSTPQVFVVNVTIQ